MKENYLRLVRAVTLIGILLLVLPVSVILQLTEHHRMDAAGMTHALESLHSSAKSGDCRKSPVKQCPVLEFRGTLALASLKAPQAKTIAIPLNSIGQVPCLTSLFPTFHLRTPSLPSETDLSVLRVLRI